MLMYWSCACGRWRAQRFAQGFTVGPNVWFCNAGDCWELLNGDIGTWDTEPDEILSNSNSAPTPGGGKFWDDMSVALIVCIESPCGTDISARSTARSSKNPPGVPKFLSEQASSVSRSCDGVFADVIPLQSVSSDGDSTVQWLSLVFLSPILELRVNRIASLTRASYPIHDDWQQYLLWLYPIAVNIVILSSKCERV